MNGKNCFPHNLNTVITGKGYPIPRPCPVFPALWKMAFYTGLFTVAGSRQGAPMSLGCFCPENRLHPDLGFRCPASPRPSKCTCCICAFPRPQTDLRPGAEAQGPRLEECRLGGPRVGPLELCLIQPFPVSLFCTPLSCRRLPLPGDVLCRGLCGMGHRWSFSEPQAY